MKNRQQVCSRYSNENSLHSMDFSGKHSSLTWRVPRRQTMKNEKILLMLLGREPYLFCGTFVTRMLKVNCDIRMLNDNDRFNRWIDEWKMSVARLFYHSFSAFFVPSHLWKPLRHSTCTHILFHFPLMSLCFPNRTEKHFFTRDFEISFAFENVFEVQIQYTEEFTYVSSSHSPPGFTPITNLTLLSL